MIVDRHTARLIIAGAIAQQRLPRARRAPRPGQVIPVQVSYGADPSCHVVVSASHLSRDRHHDPAEPCDRLGRSRMSEQPDQAQNVCVCPLIGHERTLDAASLQALGHDNLTDYVSAWLLERDTAWLERRAPASSDAPTTFMAAIEALAELTEEQLLDRWRARWADLPVWVVEWTVEREQPRLLAQPGRLRYRSLPSGRQIVDETEDPLGDHGYTTRLDRALPEEPEAIDADRLDPGWARAAGRRRAAARGRLDKPPGARRAA